MTYEEELRQKVQFRIAHIIINDRLKPGSAAVDVADQILAIPELRDWAMEKYGLVENGTVNIATLQSKKRTPLIIGD